MNHDVFSVLHTSPGGAGTHTGDTDTRITQTNLGQLSSKAWGNLAIFLTYPDGLRAPPPFPFSPTRKNCRISETLLDVREGPGHLEESRNILIQTQEYTTPGGPRVPRTAHVRRVTLLLAGETAPRRARVRAAAVNAAAAATANSGPIGTIGLR